MKKFVGLILLSVILTAACTQTNQICIDSDGGVNYYKRGSVNPSPCYEEPCPDTGIWIDQCLDETTLLEYSCENLDGERYTCPNGCENGVCVETDFNLCEEDSDCIKVLNGCCECGEGKGGRATSINKEYEKRWDERLLKECGSFVECGFIDSDAPSCFKEPKCIENKCTLV